MAKNVKKRGGDGGGSTAPVDQDEKMVRFLLHIFTEFYYSFTFYD